MRRYLATAIVISLATVHPSFAQPEGQAAGEKTQKKKGAGTSNPLEERLDALNAKLEEANKASAESATALKTLQELQTQVNSLRQEVEQSRTALRGYEETRKKVEEYERRIKTMESDTAILQRHVMGSGATAGYDNGFFVAVPNRRFLLRVRGLFQAGYEATLYQGDVYEGTSLGENVSTFALHRAMIELEGNVFIPQIGYHVALDFGSVEPGPFLEGYGEFRPTYWLNFRGGKQKVPMGRQLMMHSSGLQFIDRSGVVDAFAPGWDTGLMIYGDLQRFGLSYQVGMFNGAGAGAAVNDNKDFLYAVRLSCEPLGALIQAEGDPEVSKLKLGLAGSFTFNKANSDLALRRGVVDVDKAAKLNDLDGDGSVDVVDVYGVGAELSARISTIALQSEFFYRYERPGAAGDDRSFWGIYTQLGLYPAHGPIEVAMRYGYWKPHHYGLDRRSLLPQSIHELAVVGTILTWMRYVKWQAEYSHQWQQEIQSAPVTQTSGPALDLKVHQIKLQLQVGF